MNIVEKSNGTSIANRRKYKIGKFHIGNPEVLGFPRGNQNF